MISIHALHEESDGHFGVFAICFHISIHALHEESDFQVHAGQHRSEISIHALHEESDRNTLARLCLLAVFQSTLSMRRATRGVIGVRQPPAISIHALHEESDDQ